jgi:hypothetical protein
MRRRLLFTLATAATLVGLAVLALVQGSPPPAMPNRPEPALAAMPACADAKVSFRLSTDTVVYLPGQPVQLTLEVRSTATDWCKVAGQCDEVAPLSVFDSSRMLWSDRPCYNHEWDAVKIALPPGRLVTYRGKWSTQGARIGLYEARAAFLKVSFLVL